MRVERELMRGAGPLAVMKLLERCEMYGYEILDALCRRSDGVLAMGQSTLYPLLYNLESKGLIEGQWRSAGSRDGASRDRKYYRLTPKGRRRLAHDTSQWDALARAMAGVLNAPGGAA